MNHKQKIKLARKMLTPKELKNGVPLFSSKQWLFRKFSKLARELSKNKNIDHEAVLKSVQGNT